MNIGMVANGLINVKNDVKTKIAKVIYESIGLG